MNWIKQLLDVPSTDPDDARRRKILNILLVGMVPIIPILWLATFVVDMTNQYPADVLYLGSAMATVGIVTTFFLNRYGPGWLASMLFVMLLAIIVVISDEPKEVTGGRALLSFAIPIIAASVLMRPYASFIAAGLISLIIIIVARAVGLLIDPFPMFPLFVIALVSWLAAQTMERALKDLRLLNEELEQRVQDRTQALAGALAKNEAILNGIADGVIVFDNNGAAIVANPAVTHLIEHPAQEVIGKDIKALMGEEVQAEDQEMVAGLLYQEDTHTPSLRFGWGDKTLSVSVAPVHTEADEAIGSVAVFRDYTREAEVEQMKSAFVSMVSHDLRTPLSVIIGYSGMLREAVYGALNEQQLKVMDRINTNTTQLLNIVNNLLDQAQIEAGKLTLHVDVFEPGKLLEDMESVMSLLVESKGLKLSCHVADNTPTRLSGDRQRLHQILLNLVGNAIKFTNQGEIKAQIYQLDPHHWALEVCDTGPGIPPEARGYIFESFRQVDETPTREHQGVGLGLTIVRQLVDLMGGEILLSSEVGRGSTFTIILPLVPAYAQPA